VADINVTLGIVDGINGNITVGDDPINANISIGGGGSSVDEKVKYDTNDAAADFLSAKIVAGAGISLAEGIGGDADKLVITSTAVGTDEKVKYDAGDTTAGYFSDKIVAGAGIGIAEGAGLTENKSVITNSDLGSSAVSGHNLAFTHANIHAQGTDQGLDTGGINAVTAAQAKAGYTHSGVAHAPSGAQVNNISDVNATDLTDGGTTNLHSHANDHASGSDNETAVSIIALGIDEIEFAVIKSYMI
jgi:hypothetical protein